MSAPILGQRLEATLPIIPFIEYSDFQCPFTADGQPVVERVLAVYGQVLKYEFRHHPFHRYSEAAARRYEAIRDHDEALATRFRRTVFREQSRLVSTGENYLDDLATRLGFDPGQLARESKAQRITNRLAQNRAEVLDKKLERTPSYVVAGVTFVGPTSFDQFEQVICRELRKIRQGSPEEDRGDCWSLVEPDWKRLEEIEAEASGQ